MRHSRKVFASVGTVGLVALSLTSGPGAADDVTVAPPAPTPDVTVAPPAPTPDVTVAPASPPPDVQVQTPPSEPAPAPVGADQLQPAATAQDLQPAAPAQDVQPAAPAQDVQPAAPAQDVQPAAGGTPTPTPVADPATPPPPAPKLPHTTSDRIVVRRPPPHPGVAVGRPRPTPHLEVRPLPKQPDVEVRPSTAAPGVEVRPLPVQPDIQVPQRSTGPSVDEEPARGRSASCGGGSFHDVVGGGISVCRFEDGHVESTGRLGFGVGGDAELDPDVEVPDQGFAVSGDVGGGIPNLIGGDVGFRAPIGDSEDGTELVGNLDLLLVSLGISHDTHGWHGSTSWAWHLDKKHDKKAKRRGRSKAGLGGSLDAEFPLTGTE